MKSAISISATVLFLSLAAAGPALAGGADTRLDLKKGFIAAGGDAAYLLKPDGAVWAWGNNSAGQIGDGTSSNRLHPVSISVGCTQLAAGESFALCIGQDGTLWSWGFNNMSQLGRTGSIYVPTQVGGNMDYRSIAAGYDHAVAIKYDGTLWVWGNNATGQLGLNDKTKRTTPTQVTTAGDGWMAIAAGAGFTLALKANGTLWAAGANDSGQLGNGTTSTTPQLTFKQIGTARWKAVSAGLSHVVAIREEGLLYAWGSNSSGQAGNNSTTPCTTPTRITVASGPGSWRSVSAGWSHSIAVQADGSLWGWGDNSHGELALGNTASPKATAVQIGTARTAEYVTAGRGFTMRVTGDGTLKLWGQGTYGVLGRGTTSNATSAVTPWVSSSTDGWNLGVKPMVPGAGMTHSTTVVRDGQLLTWGANGKGQLGDGTTNSTLETAMPAVRPPGNDWMMATGGDNVTHAVKVDGTMWVFGSNINGEMGIGNEPQGALEADPKKVGSFTDWLKVSDHYAQSIGLRANGYLYAAGDNAQGQLGINATTANVYPYTQVNTPDGKRWAAVAVSEVNGYAIMTDGTLWSWGENLQKQLGRGANQASTITPVLVGGGYTDWVSVGGGQNWAVGVRANGQAYSWGANNEGQLGIGNTNTQGGIPQLVQGGYRIVLLGTSRASTIAKGAFGNVIGWGGNGSGELGMGDKSHILSGQPVGYWGSNLISGGADHFIEVNPFSTTGFASGNNDFGQLGDGTKTEKLYPVQILLNF